MQRIVLTFCLLLGAAPAAAAQENAPPEVPAAAPVVDDNAGVSSALSSLRNDLERLIRSPGWNDDRWSVMVVSLTRGDTLYDHGADDALAPASNLKLFTTAAGLYYLGPDFRYNTFLMVDGTIADGVLSGDVVLYGTGDPTLSSRYGGQIDVWEAFADTLAALGVQEVRGDVVGDGTYFTGPATGEGWQTNYMNASYAAPASALTFSENVVTLEIGPGEQAGWRPEVSAVEGGDAIAVVNQATTVARGRTSIRVRRAAYDGPILVQGQIARGVRPILRSVPASDPPQFAAAALHEVLLDRGIKVTGEARTVAAASASAVTGRTVYAPALRNDRPMRVLAIHTSQPILEVLDVINRHSHNLMAEQVLRTVGRVALGEGSVAAGEEAVRAMLDREIEAPGAGVRMYDGSGLSVLNRTSARGIIHLLSFIARSPFWEAYWSTLPEAASRDGLR
ncbi:MAG: D-alanyl-D-alanine carboxypeptidase/D-alanyl-D-alanine endopeptidase, partial [Longimicrobiales bacterium]